MRAWTRDKPIYPWSLMATGQTVIWQISSATEARNIRRNVSQNGVRNGKSFRVKLDRAASVMHITRIK